MELCKPVDTGRGAFLVFPARDIVRLFAKYVVGGDVDEGSVVFLCRFGEVAYGSGVEKFGKVSVILSFVYVGVCRAVYDDIYGVFARHFFYGVCIGDVKLCDIGKYVSVGGACRDVAQTAAKLSVGSGH